MGIIGGAGCSVSHGRGVAQRLAHLVRDQGVGGSNPLTPTMTYAERLSIKRFLSGTFRLPWFHFLDFQRVFVSAFCYILFLMCKAFSGRITGRVQGVGYRYFARDAARDLQINGWVRNRPDGSVELTAVGHASDLEEYLRLLKRGPLSGRVESVDIDWLADAPRYQDFQILG